MWTWTAICADTKLIAAWMVGDCTNCSARIFVDDLVVRLANRVQLTTDGHKVYLDVVERAFGSAIDYAMLVSLYGAAGGDGPEHRYSPGECCGTIKGAVTGTPDAAHVSTSFVERQNLTMRMLMRRFTRLTNGFSRACSHYLIQMQMEASKTKAAKCWSSLS